VGFDRIADNIITEGEDKINNSPDDDPKRSITLAQKR
jgi:hypothetical protein